VKRALALVLLLAACSRAVVASHAAACTAQEVDRFLADCVEGSALVIHCQQFASTHAGCNDCLRPQRATNGEGPLRERAGGVEANLEGCRRLGACAHVDAGDSTAALRAASLAWCGR
jgi:hypothetical protein